MANLKCKDCLYYWATPREKHATCKFEEVTLFDIPPCQEDLWIDKTGDIEEYEQYLEFLDEQTKKDVIITHILDDDDEDGEE